MRVFQTSAPTLVYIAAVTVVDSICNTTLQEKGVCSDYNQTAHPLQMCAKLGNNLLHNSSSESISAKVFSQTRLRIIANEKLCQKDI